jgi:hypothetical protein
MYRRSPWQLDQNSAVRKIDIAAINNTTEK